MTPPPDLGDADVLAVAAAEWLPDADGVGHLPVGFGAHHWAVSAGGERRLFVTADRVEAGAHHDAGSLEAAYAGAAALADRLAFVVGPLPTRAGRRTAPVAPGLLLSATAWVAGRRPAEAAGALPLVHALHHAEPPPGLGRWAPLVPASLADDLAVRLGPAWDAGPHGPAAREALRAALGDVGDRLAAYHRLAAAARERPWVATHGEPHERNQLSTVNGTRLVDWETLLLAPPERDLRWLAAPGADPAMLELFDLEWRLDEVAQYAAWFEGPHGDGPDDRTALAGLLAALDPSRPG